MAFISGTSTVTVSAKLTDMGKKKLYESIENNSSGFVTKFAIGDSDANYANIAAGGSSLAAGHVPEVGDFKPSIRSYALYQGVYRPGFPVVLVNDEYGTDDGITRSLSIGANEQVNFAYNLKSEWPKNEQFSEFYHVTMQNPGNITNEALYRLFTSVGPLTNGQYAFQFNGGASDQELETLIGTSGSGNSTVIPIKIVGKTTHAQIMYNIRLVQ